MIQNRGGYTIMEVLIVIAVTGVMFLLAAVAFSGRQAQVQFDQAVREFEGSIRDIMNDVTTGYYPNNTAINCDVTSASNSAPPVITDTGNTGIGKNSKCLYVGKAIQFHPETSDKESKYRVINLIGKRYINSASNNIAETLSTIRPQPAITASNDTSITESIPYGIEVTKIVEVTNPATVPPTTKQYGVLVLMPSFKGGSISNAQSIQVAGVNSAANTLGMTNANARTLISAITDNSTAAEGYTNLSANNGLIICLSDGGSKNASLTIGVSGSETTVLRIGDYNYAGVC